MYGTPFETILELLLTIFWFLFNLVSVIAGVFFVKAVSRIYNWCFLIGAVLGVVGSLVVPVTTQMNLDSEMFYTYLSGFDVVGGILMAYGIIGHAMSYTRMAVHFSRDGILKGGD